MSRNTRRIAALAALAVTAGWVPIQLAAGSAQAAPTDLFFSEYIEGTSNNKALEIYNNTGAPVNLTGYSVQMFFNGNPAAGLTINLTGTVAAGDVHVLAHASAVAAILDEADQTNGAGWFNGDDAVTLRTGTTVIDSIGQAGFDPGTEWGTGVVSTADNTLRRKADIDAADTVTNDPFDPAVQWDGFATDTFDGLGCHLAGCITTPRINEFSVSTAGTDVEYLEVIGQPGADLSTYTLLEIEGDAGTVTGTVDEIVPVGTTDAAGFWVANLPANAIENGTLTLLLVSGFTGALNQDLDGDNDGVFDATPWTAVVDAVAVDDGGAGDLTYGVPALGPNYDGQSSFAPGGASRFPDGHDTDTASDWVRNDFDLAGIPGFTGTPTFGEAYNTPGAPNALVPEPPPDEEECGEPVTPIWQIQGSGAASPIAGQVVSIEGVVVGDFQGGAAFNGFHVQAPVGDGDPTTSDGIFVFSNTAVDAGQTVRVRGTVTEFNGLTELSNVSDVLVCAPLPMPQPTALDLPVGSLAEFEAVEGMLVTFPQALVISEYFNFDRFGEIVLTDARQPTPTAVVEPGAPAIALAAAQSLARITLDDGLSGQNPEFLRHPNGAQFTLDNRFRGGDTVANVTGVMDFAFSLYRIQPTEGADYAVANPRPDGPPDVGGGLKVGSFNVLNYFTTLGSRGATDLFELERQERKLVSAISEMDADIVGLLEIENNTDAIARLVGLLNDEVGAGTYAYVDTGTIGTDAIKVALIYQPASASPLGDYEVLSSADDPRFIDTLNRPALAQSFIDGDTGGVFTVAVNHLKSKGSDCNAVGDPDIGDGQGNCNQTRTAAAEALVDWLATDPTGSGSADFLIIGDLNSYDKEDPIDSILEGADDATGTADDYVDLVAHFGGELAYSYVFDGKIGYLDHGLANSSMFGDVTGAAVWHINADEPDVLDYTTDFDPPNTIANLYAPDEFRSSDHDAVLIGLDVCDAIAPQIAVTLDRTELWPPNHQYVTVNATVEATDNFDDDVAVALVSVTSSEPDDGDDDGNTINDIMIDDADTFRLRAERSGTGSGRTYTVTYVAVDDCGNATIGTATVFVPLDKD